MRIQRVSLFVFLTFLMPAVPTAAAPIDDVKAAVAKGSSLAKKARRGPRKRRVTSALRALEQYSYAFRAIQAANLAAGEPEMVKKVRGAIAELNGLEIVKGVKRDTRAEFVVALEEGRNAEAVELLERLLNMDARDAGVEQALLSLRESLGQGSKP